MSHRTDRLRRDLEALGCTLDLAAHSRSDQDVYRHPAAPEERFLVWSSMNDSQATTTLRRARKVAGLATSGSTKPQTLKERATITRQREKSDTLRAKQAAAERVAEKERRLAMISSGSVAHDPRKANESSARISAALNSMSETQKRELREAAIEGSVYYVARILEPFVPDDASRVSLAHQFVDRAKASA